MWPIHVHVQYALSVDNENMYLDIKVKIFQLKELIKQKASPFCALQRCLMTTIFFYILVWKLLLI